MHPLDNPVWHALHGPQHTLAEGGAGAVRYPSDVAPFAAVPDEQPGSSWEALRDLVGPGNLAVLFRDRIDEPPGWERVGEWPTVQLVAPDRLSGPADRARDRWEVFELGPGEVNEMKELVERTEPGPFADRTITVGTYLGVRDQTGRLVAMAGERMHPPGHREISAVCTDPAWRGRGLGALLTAELTKRIATDGEQPFLHAVADNTAALGLYEAMGFRRRRMVEVALLQAPGPGQRSPGHS